MVYFSVTTMVAIISSVLLLTSATSSSSFMSSLSVDKVIGIGQKVPFEVVILTHTLFQSDLVIKPSRGVNPPIPNIITSPNSLEEQDILGKDFALSNSVVKASPSKARGFRVLLPWGGTNSDIFSII